jgi:aminopeptidase N
MRLFGDAGAEVPAAWTDGLRAVLTDDAQDPAFRALAAELPGIDEMSREIAGRGDPADPDAIHDALTRMRRSLGERLRPALAGLYESAAPAGPYRPDPESSGRRALRNRCLALLAAPRTAEAFARAERQFREADNMTDSLAALAVLSHEGAPQAEDALAAFHDRWRHDPLVIDKWLALQATAPLPGTLEKVRTLTDHPAFDWKNPNRFRGLIGAFAEGNPVAFHAADGSGYRFVADWLLTLDGANPQTAARVTGAFETLGRYDEARQRMMRNQLERMAGTEGLSRNTREIVERILGR